MRSLSVYRLSIDSMMAALYFVLAYLAIRIGNITITPASVTIVIVSLLYSPLDALSVALVGELLNQMVRYGASPTTALWLMPVLLRASIISLTAHFCRKKGTYLENHLIGYFITLMIAALFTTAANTGIIYLDAWLLKYPVEYKRFETIFRFISGMVTSVLVAILAIPVVKVTSKMKIGRELTPKDQLTQGIIH